MRRRKRARKDRQPVLKKLCAALLQSFRGQHGKKIKGSAWGNWEPWDGQQPFWSNPNGIGDRTTMLRQLLIGADRAPRRHALFSWTQTQQYQVLNNLKISKVTGMTLD